MGSKDSYEPRPVDEQLREAALNWLSTNSQLRWISLRSKPGNGNTLLIRQFKDWLMDNQARFGETRLITVEGGSTYHPKLVGPVGIELAQLKRTAQRTRLQQMTHRIRSAPSHRKLLGLVLLLFFVALGTLWIGFSEYNKSPDAPWSDLINWTHGFVKFMLANWYKLPVWLFTEASFGLMFSFAISSILLYLSEGRIFSKPPQEKVSRKELKALRSDKNLAEALDIITRPRRGLMMLIDDAQSLPEYEKRLLRDLVMPVERPELQAFSEKYRILIVTVETGQVAWKELPEKLTLALNVPEFTLDQLHDMARKQLKETFEQLRESEQQILLQKGQENIKALFTQNAETYDKGIERVFEKARDDSIRGVFDLADLMAYWAVAHTHSVEKQELLAWLESPQFSSHLQEFGLKPTRDSQQLVKNFAATKLVRRQGQTYFFKLPECQSLQRWLTNHSDETKRLLARAHYFWFQSLWVDVSEPIIKPSSAALVPVDKQLAIRESAWHASQVGKYLDDPADVLEEAAGLSQAERRERSVAVASVLIAASVFCRGEGDVVEASDLIVDALEWLIDTSDPSQREWVELGVEQLWVNYWLLGSPSIIKHLEELASKFSWLESSPGWRVNQRLSRLLHGDLVLPPKVDESLLSNELLNLERLIVGHHDIKLKYGPIPEGLHDSSIIITRPQEVSGKNLSEIRLRHLYVAALVHRNDSTRLREALAGWSRRLKEAVPAEHQLGDKALQYYDEACYWHLLTDLTCNRLNRIDDDKEIPMSRKDQAYAELFERIQDEYQVPLPQGASSLDAVLQEALAAYDRLLKVLALLGWRPLLMDANFRLGELLCNYGPITQETQTSEPWWWHWNVLFQQTIRMEKEFGWTIQTPFIYRIRWKFFEKEDNERSVEDAYNALQEAKRANYPLRLILAWHRQTVRQLTNHSKSYEDRRRDAALHEEWSEKLASLAEAKEFWRFDTLEHERAHSLHFAAQARRIVGDLERAEELLDKAELLLDPPAENGSPPGKNTSAEAEPQDLKDLRIGLKLQRAWLYQNQSRKEKYYEAIQVLWNVIDFKHEECALVLQCLMDFEDGGNLLGQPWPQQGLKPQADPANRKLWLPTSWFNGVHALQLENRFEFRFYQLLNTVNYVANVEILERQADLQLEEVPTALNMLMRTVDGTRTGIQRVAHRSGPHLLFKPEILRLLASADWLGVNKFAEVSRSFADYGRRYSHSSQTHTLIINLLEAVRFYFAEVDAVVSEEMQTLQLLIAYEPHSSKNYHAQYAHLLLEQKHLLRYEKLSLEGTEGAGWYAVAQEMDGYLSVLVDTTLLFRNMNEELDRYSISREEFMQQKADRLEDLQKAEAEYARGDEETCLRTITPALPPEPSPWVFVEDLRALYLWLQCMPRNEMTQEEIAQRDAQLRTQSRQFINQFSLIIKEPDVQQFVIRILKAIEESVYAPS